MDPNELIKAAPDLAKAATAVSAAVPFTAIVKRMLGPAADELAEMLRDQVRLYRYERQLKCLEKAEMMAHAAGFTPQTVPPKILFPLLEGVSVEENEGLHDMWSALLANAASPHSKDLVRPGFLATLRQMSPDEAVLLRWMCEQTWSPDGETTFPIAKLFDVYSELGLLPPKPVIELDPRDALTDTMRFGTCLDSLEASQLIRCENHYQERIYKLTTRGDEFVHACRPPKPKENA